jgi:sodium-dependent dicarboxylate transporter 2/3/5
VPEPSTQSPGRTRSPLLFSVSLAVAVLLTGALLADGRMPREAAFMSGIFALAALLWVTEALPLFATSLLVIGLQILLLANPGDWPGLGFAEGPSPDFRTLLNAAADPVIVLFFGGFLLAAAAVKEGVDRAMSELLLRPFGHSPFLVLAGVMVATATFSMWMSNTATAAMMITLVIPMLATLPAGEPFRKALTLGVAFAANIGGMGTPIGSPPNAVAVGFLRNAGYRVGFIEWMVVAVPLMAVLLAACCLLLWFLFRPRTAGLRLNRVAQKMTPRGWYVVAVFTLTALLWLGEPWHGLPAAVVALLPAVAFTMTGLISRQEVNSLEWNILILIGGGIALGAGMQLTGLDTLVVQWLATGPSAVMAAAGLAVLVIVTLVLSTFMSNTAAANLLLPIGISFAAAVGGSAAFPVIQTAMCIALAASVSMALPISTPPNAIAYARGEFNTRDMALAGSLIGALAAIFIIAGSGPVIRLWGLGN